MTSQSVKYLGLQDRASLSSAIAPGWIKTDVYFEARKYTPDSGNCSDGKVDEVSQKSRLLVPS